MTATTTIHTIPTLDDRPACESCSEALAYHRLHVDGGRFNYTLDLCPACRVEVKTDGLLRILDDGLIAVEAVAEVLRPTPEPKGTVVRADEVRVRDYVQVESWDGSTTSECVTRVDWVGDDIILYTFGERELFTTSEGNDVVVTGRA